ncbi:MAG: hypothetical protein EOR77_14535 [Mesorhizobium sp.]|nr:MAG: hypothetical protein EOR77_14535 [Mesorhizobium sp.]RWM79131.1 MAG: hypothetical protein EOR83_29925 [Mesorhizobium sp.]TIO12323.1 MAG: hypothetical protein E5X86_33755 [Mesorhizobium sp.]TIO40718.1 MAG: hypothetical protein E5X81_30235 [Mesorhizobium sp.]TIP90775.1 MAG: hypothetical protein E5X58_22660 [Mesorhizobium sp.]
MSDDELERRYGAPTWAMLCYPTHAEWIEDDARLTRLAQDGRLASPTARQDAREPAKGEIASSGSPAFQNQPQALAKRPVSGTARLRTTWQGTDLTSSEFQSLTQGESLREQHNENHPSSPRRHRYRADFKCIFRLSGDRSSICAGD